MRIFTITVLCLCVVLTGCTSKNSENKPSSVNDSVLQESSVPNANNQGTGQAGEIDEAVPQEVKSDDLGPFQKGVSFDEFQFGEKYQDIALLFQNSLEAWAAKDKELFREYFITTDVADSHMFFLEDSADYEFVGTPYLIDQSSENGRINIIFRYRTSEQIDEIKGNTMTVIHDEDNIWKISLID